MLAGRHNVIVYAKLVCITCCMDSYVPGPANAKPSLVA